MNKLHIIFALFAILFVVAAPSAFADMDLFYPGAATSIAPVNAGDVVNYEYVVNDLYSSGIAVHRVIELLDSGFTSLNVLVDTSDNGFYYGTETLDTTGLTLGTYYIFGTATDTTGMHHTDYISFDVLSNNNAPVFNAMALSYSYPLNLANVDVVDLAAYGFDADGDVMTYSVSASSNPSVTTCSLVGTTLNCDLVSVGTATVDVTVTDGTDSTTVTVSIEVTQAVNNAPEFDGSFPLAYSFPILPTNADVVDVALYASDADNDPISYMVDYSMADTSVISDCNTVGSVVNCNWAGLGTTQVDVILYDGFNFTHQLVTIEVTPVGGSAPVFVNMTQFYQYHVSTGSASVVDLAAFAFDADNDPMTFSMTASSDASIADCSLTGSVVDCAFPGNLGIIDLDVTVFDGSLATTVTLYINVYDYVGNNTAPEFMNMAQFYMYDINAATSATIDINHGFDAENDPLSYYLDTGFTNPAVMSCSLAGTDVDCAFNGLGLTTFDAIVSDGVLSSVETVTVLVYDSNANNNMPYFNNLDTSYVYPLLLGNTNVVDLANHGVDADNDPLTYILDTGFTSSAVLDSDLVANSVVHADLNGVGITAVRVIVFDGQWASDAYLTIEVTDSSVTGPVAVIDAPTSVCADEEFEVDGTDSYTISGSTIDSYNWVITDDAGNPLVSSNGPVALYTITTAGNYYVSLQVVDSNGDSAFSVEPFVVTNNCQSGLDFGTESGLKIRSFGVYGFDFEKAYVDGELMIVADLENVADVEFKDVRMIYTLPEFGLRFKTSAFDLLPGERTTVQISGFVPDYVDADTYYPYIEFSDNEFRRVKAGYLEVYEQ